MKIKKDVKEKIHLVVNNGIIRIILRGLVMYPKCKEGFHNVGCCICSPTCPNGFTDIGVSCQKPSDYGRGVGYPW